MNKKVLIAICGAGGRGKYAYAPYVKKNPELAEIVAVADPKKENRDEIAAEYSVKPENVFNDWREMAAAPKMADAVIIATQDKMHTEPAIAFMEKGYHILLEKPMATTEAECRKIADTARKKNAIFAVCHVLRYTPYFRKLKELIDSKIIGDVVTVRHTENVGYWHQAHSFVRGHWRNSQESSPMILAKSCHDMDILIYLTGKRCVRLSSFGSLKHFKRSEAPNEATPRCLNCPLKNKCPYSALEIYMTRLKKGETGWPLNVVTNVFTEDALLWALREWPYGRCVYMCDNNVVDHQVVSMQFEDQVTAVFTMSAFSRIISRETAVHGTLGEIWGDGITLNVADFLTGEVKVVDPNVHGAADAEGGHGGGDTGIMRDFVAALASNDKSKLISDADTSLESHLMAFAAEKSRLSGGAPIEISPI